MIARAMASLALVAALGGCASSFSFDYNHLPKGYHWRTVIDEKTGQLQYYGRDPVTGWTVYVGPDSTFYTYNHPGGLRPQDLGSRWTPHDI